MLILECVEPKKKKMELEGRRPEWATAHCEASVMTEKVYRDRASWALCRDRLFLVPTRRAGQVHDRAYVRTTGLRGRRDAYDKELKKVCCNRKFLVAIEIVNP